MHETRPPIYTDTGINSKWIKELNVSQETIKTLKENLDDNIWDISHSNIFSEPYISSGKGNKRKKMNNGTKSN